jgi:hypothetical protein
MKVAWAGTEVLLEDTFGEVKSRRMRFHPGSRCTRALK